MSEKITKLKEERAYNLSDASKKTSSEYGEVNTLTSLIYNRFKQVTELYWKRPQLQKLRMLVLQVIRTAPVEQTGNRKLWDGNLKMLEGFQLNHKATAGNLFRQKISLDVDNGRVLRVAVPSFPYHHVFEKAHPNATTAQVKLYVFSFDVLEKTSSGRSVVLLSQPRGQDLKEDYNLNITLDDNRLTLIVCKVAFLTEPFSRMVNDRQYIGATLLKAIYIKDGKEFSFIPEENIVIPPQLDAEPGNWEDLG